MCSRSTIWAVVKSKCAVEKGNVCIKKCRDSDQNDDLCTDYQVLCRLCKSCLKYALIQVTLKSVQLIVKVLSMHTNKNIHVKQTSQVSPNCVTHPILI